MLISLFSVSQITVDTTTSWQPMNITLGSTVSDNVELDVNQDGINDVFFKPIIDIMFSQCIGFSVTSLNGAEVLTLPTDGYPFGMQINDIVQYSTGFTTVSDAILIKDDIYYGGYLGYFYIDQIKYLGVKIGSQYGYIGLKPLMGYLGMNITGYAFENLIVSNIETPINDLIGINYLYSMNGQLIQIFSNKIDMILIPNGMYIIVNGKQKYKVIKQN